MSVELHADDGAVRSASALETMMAREPVDRPRPNVSGDLPTVFAAAPMFRRAVLGYDRFQVDSYVQWAEDELATADREREHLEARHFRARTELDQARELLAHTSSGGEFLQTSRRIGSLLAVAADEAESIRTEAESIRTEAERHRSAAVAQAERTLAEAEQALTEARAEATRMEAETASAAECRIAEAARIVGEAEETLAHARTEAKARLEKVRAMELRAAEHAEDLRRQAAEEAAAALVRARNEVVRMLGTGREERRRADAGAAATRARLDEDAVTRRAALLRDVARLERRRAALRAEVELLAGQQPSPTGSRLQVHLHRLLGKLQSRPRFLRTP